MSKTIDTSENVKIKAEPENLKKVRSMVQSICDEIGLSEDVKKLLVVAVDEAVTNIVNHAQAIDQQGEVEVHLDLNSVRFKARIEDHTNGTSIESTGDDESGSYLEESKRHKLGIFLMQQIMDEINYTFKKGFQNDLEMLRFFKDSDL